MLDLAVMANYDLQERETELKKSRADEERGKHMCLRPVSYATLHSWCVRKDTGTPSNPLAMYINYSLGLGDFSKDAH